MNTRECILLYDAKAEMSGKVTYQERREIDDYFNSQPKVEQSIKNHGKKG